MFKHIEITFFCYFFFICQLSPGGVLDEETIAQGLSNLGRSANGTQHTFLKLSIPVTMLFELVNSANNPKHAYFLYILLMVYTGLM